MDLGFTTASPASNTQLLFIQPHPKNIGYSAFLPPISVEGDQRASALGAGPSPAKEYLPRPTGIPLYLPSSSFEPYPSDGPATRIHASRRFHWPEEVWSLILRYSSDIDCREPPVWRRSVGFRLLTSAVTKFAPLITAVVQSTPQVRDQPSARQ